MTVPIIGDIAAQPTEPITYQPSGVIGVPRCTGGGIGLLGRVCACAGASAPAPVAIAISAAPANFRMSPLHPRNMAFYTAIGRAPCLAGSGAEPRIRPNAAWL